MSYRFTLVGSVNAGKSSIFNRLIGSYRAIVTDIAGTTRDFVDHTINLTQGPLTIMDTPGIDTDCDVDEKTQYRINTADMIIFVLNAQTGRTAREESLHKHIVRTGSKPKTIIVINKSDIVPKTDLIDLEAAAYGLGYQKVFTTHTKNRSGVSRLLAHCAQQADIVLHEDEVLTDYQITHEHNENIELFDDETDEIISTSDIQSGTQIDPTFLSPTAPLGFALLGKPNAGKSSLTNMLAESAISRVDAQAGTTRDYVMYHGTWGSHQRTLFDTAGLRKRGKRRDIEAIAFEKTVAMIGYLRPIIVYIIDTTLGPVDTDYHFLTSLIKDGHCIVLGLNKCDIASSEQIDYGRKQLACRYPHFPIVKLSAHNPSCRQHLIQTLNNVRKNRFLALKTPRLNKAIINYALHKQPTFPKSKICKVMYVTQSHINPTRLQVFLNHQDRLTNAYQRRIENAIRSEYPLHGVPILFTYKQRGGTTTPTKTPAHKKPVTKKTPNKTSKSKTNKHIDRKK